MCNKDINTAPINIKVKEEVEENFIGFEDSCSELVTRIELLKSVFKLLSLATESKGLCSEVVIPKEENEEDFFGFVDFRLDVVNQNRIKEQEMEEDFLGFEDM